MWARQFLYFKAFAVIGTFTLVACSQSKGNNTPANAPMALVNIPACSEQDLAPFDAVGTGVPISQIPVGLYTYTGGQVYVESQGLNPQVKLRVIDTEPNSNPYPGTVACQSTMGYSENLYRCQL